MGLEVYRKNGARVPAYTTREDDNEIISVVFDVMNNMTKSNTIICPV